MMESKRLQLVGAVAILLAGAAAGDMIRFRGASGEHVPNPNLDARVVYDYDEGDGLLSVRIFNDTIPSEGYAITSLQFNVSNDVGGLAVQSDDGYALTLAQEGNRQDILTKRGNRGNRGNRGRGRSGSFGWTLDLGHGANGIQAGESALFILSVTPEHWASLGAGDFFSGPSSHGRRGDGSRMQFSHQGGTGSTWCQGDKYNPIIPEPASMLLLGLGVAGLAVMRRGRAS